MATAYDRVRATVYAAHDEDPNKITVNGTEQPYETHYAHKMETYLAKRSPSASPVLRLAIVAQHLRRWEVPRDSYPRTKLGYHSWRTFLKKRQAELLAGYMEAEGGFTAEEVERARGLVMKEGLAKGGEEVQVLEDVACLVFLDDQFAEFKEKHDEAKIVGILRKTWGKMSERGHEMALELDMDGECRALVGKALEGS